MESPPPDPEAPRGTLRVRGRRGPTFLRYQTLKVEVVAGADAGRCETFSLPLVRLGSAEDNDLVLTDPTVSRHHAELARTDAGVVLEDLGSTNGSFLGDTQVMKAPVPAGTTLRLGEVELRLTDAEQTLVAGAKDVSHFGPLAGASSVMQELYALVEAAAPTSVSVLITGESGTGKELIAQALHDLSGRPGPLVVFDAASTDPELIRAELFGHEKGAFTGAAGARAGAFREAQGGTLLIDEIGELPLDLQPRLLRALESRQVQPLGSDRRHRVDVRVLASTHRDLAAMVEAGEFRADLYHRLAVVPVVAPPLREREGDLPVLVEALREASGLTVQLTPAALEALAAHSWPGNVRELRNVLERCAVLVRGRPVEPGDLGLGSSPATPGPGDQARTLRELEREAIQQALERHQGNKSAAARQLGIGLTTLKDKLKRYARED